MKGLTLDAGALIAFDRNDRATVQLLERALAAFDVVVPAGVVGQVWRDGRRQARLARLLDDLELVPLDGAAARAAGKLCGAARTADVIDASVVLTAKARGHAVATSDPEDLRRLDATLEFVRV